MRKKYILLVNYQLEPRKEKRKKDELINEEKNYT